MDVASVWAILRARGVNHTSRAFLHGNKDEQNPTVTLPVN